MIDISENERKRRDWQSKLDGITRELSDTRHSKNAIDYAIDLLDLHRHELDQKIKQLSKTREEMLDKGWDMHD